MFFKDGFQMFLKDDNFNFSSDIFHRLCIFQTFKR